MSAAATSRLWPWLLYAAVLVLAPLCVPGGFGLSLLSQMGIAIIACLSYHLLWGRSGMLSFGHALYTGAGAYLAVHTLKAVATQGAWLPVSLLPLVAGLGTALLAAPLGWLSTRKAGTPFAMITLGLGELAWALALMFPTLSGGEGGVSADRVIGAAPWGISFGPPLQLYGLIAAYTLLATLLVHLFGRTTLGTLLLAVRENPLRVGFLGYDTRTLRWLAFVFSAFLAGVSGGLAALLFEVVTAESLGTARSGALLLFCVLGGGGLLAGPVLGGVLMVLALVGLSSLTPAWMLYMGLAFVLVVMKAPDGLAGAAVRWWGQGLVWPAWRAWARGVALLAMAVPGAVLVEMAYHRQLSATLGPAMRLGPWALDTTSPWPWATAAACGVLGLAGAWFMRPAAPGRAHGD